jgi:hypothetical protein
MGAAKSAVDDLTEMFKVRQIPEADRQQKLRVIAARHFDFAEMAQSAIGDYWSRFTPAEGRDHPPANGVHRGLVSFGDRTIFGHED